MPWVTNVLTRPESSNPAKAPYFAPARSLANLVEMMQYAPRRIVSNQHKWDCDNLSRAFSGRV